MDIRKWLFWASRLDAKFDRNLLNSPAPTIQYEKYESKIPELTPTFEEISKQLKINQEILMKEISEHVDKELERLKKGIKDATM